jgi:hypothetical protein
MAAMHGVVLNLMSQATANRIPLATAAEFFLGGADYDPQAALVRAIALVAGEEEASVHLRTFVEHHCGHPVLAATATADELHRRTSAAFDDRGNDPAAIASLRAYLERLAGNESALRTALGDHALLAEIAPWSRQLTRLARAALLGLAAIASTETEPAYRAAREATRPSDEVVAATVLPPGLAPFVAGQGEAVDRFAELFAAIDRRLVAQPGFDPDASSAAT